MQIRISFKLFPCLFVLALAVLGCEPKRKIGFEEKLLATIPDRFENVSQETFSSDGKRAAYIVKAKDKGFVVLDDKPGPEYDYVNELQFSRDGKRFGYVSGIGEKYFAVIDGKQGLGSEIMTHFVFSLDGRKVAYAVKQNGKSFVVVDDQIGPQFDNVLNLTFAPDSTVLYLAKTGGIIDEHGWVMMLGNDELPVVEGNLLFHPTISPDYQNIAYVAYKDCGTYMVVNNELGKAFYQVGRPVFSPDGKLLAFTASQREGATFLVVGKTSSTVTNGGKENAGLDELAEGLEFDAVGDDIVFGVDGSVFAYNAMKNGKWIIVAGGKEFADFDGAFSPVLSADGTKLAYVAQQFGKEFIVVRDRKGPALDYVRNPRFSDDGRTVGYGARDGKQLWWKVMNLQ